MTIVDSGLQKSSSTMDKSRTVFRKVNPFKAYKSTEFNSFHPGGKVQLKNRINQIKKL